MHEILWTIFGWICKSIGILILISLVCFFAGSIWNLVTNGGRKWYYYNPAKPWKGGYWAPLLPDFPPYDQYKWNPETCRFEHKKTGQALNPWEKPEAKNRTQAPEHGWNRDVIDIPKDKPKALQSQTQKKRPEWLRFLLEENIGTLMEKRKRKKMAEQQERENRTRR